MAVLCTMPTKNPSYSWICQYAQSCQPLNHSSMRTRLQQWGRHRDKLSGTLSKFAFCAHRSWLLRVPMVRQWWVHVEWRGGRLASHGQWWRGNLWGCRQFWEGPTLFLLFVCGWPGSKMLVSGLLICMNSVHGPDIWFITLSLPQICDMLPAPTLWTEVTWTLGSVHTLGFYVTCPNPDRSTVWIHFMYSSASYPYHIQIQTESCFHSTWLLPSSKVTRGSNTSLVGCRESIGEKHRIGVEQTRQLPLLSSSKVMRVVKHTASGMSRVNNRMGVEQTRQPPLLFSSRMNEGGGRQRGQRIGIGIPITSSLQCHLSN